MQRATATWFLFSCFAKQKKIFLFRLNEFLLEHITAWFWMIGEDLGLGEKMVMGNWVMGQKMSDICQYSFRPMSLFLEALEVRALILLLKMEIYWALDLIFTVKIHIAPRLFQV